MAEDKENLPAHVALIMDGNRRWAEVKQMSKKQGHQAGVDSLREIVRYASGVGIKNLTAYGFSLDNWQRSAQEVGDLFNMVRHFLKSDLEELHQKKVQLKFLGRREKMDEDILHLMDEAQGLTAANDGMRLSVAFNYGGRDEIVRAAQALAKRGDLTQEKMDAALAPPLDLLIRTGGEQRLSDFLLWQSAYAELIFVKTLWPDFTPLEFEGCLEGYKARSRRFGGDEGA